MEKSSLASKGNAARDSGRDEHPWPCPTGATHDKTDPPSSMWAFVDLQKSMAAPLNPLFFFLPIEMTKLFCFPLFAFHILWPLWDDLKPENMESSMQRGAADFCSELLRKIADLTSVEW